MLKKALKILRENSFAAFLILVGSAVWSATMVKSGLIYSYGMGFWGPNGHDGIWHIALIKVLARGSSDTPVFAGESLKNYHIGYDLLLAWTSKLSGINPVTLYFQIFPPILALLIGVLTYKFIVDWKGSRAQALWATFFVYFGGSFGWVVNLFRSGTLGGESMFWAQQGISTLINPPFALSLVLLLGGLIFLRSYLKSASFANFALATLCFGVLIQIKAYAGILVLGALAVSGIYFFVKERKTNLLLVFLVSAFLTLILFLPFNKGAAGLFVFQPFWFLESMMGFSDRLNWPRFYSAMTNYRLGAIWIKAAPAYLVEFVIFWVGNLGIRVIKEFLVFRWFRNLKHLGWLEIFLASVIVGGAVIPMFFLQKGTPWNTIQFIYYSLFFSGILAGIALEEILAKTTKFVRTNIGIIVIVLTIPTTIGTLGQYLPSRPPAMISAPELEALKFLEVQPQGVVLTYPFDSAKAKAAEPYPPRPLYLYESTAYVSALSGHPVYLEDTVNLSITGYPWEERNQKVVKFLESSNANFVRKFLGENNIRYIYWLKGQKTALGEREAGLTKIFENDAADIYRVDLRN